MATAQTVKTNFYEAGTLRVESYDADQRTLVCQLVYRDLEWGATDTPAADTVAQTTQLMRPATIYRLQTLGLVMLETGTTLTYLDGITTIILPETYVLAAVAPDFYIPTNFTGGQGGGGGGGGASGVWDEPAYKCTSVQLVYAPLETITPADMPRKANQQRLPDIYPSAWRETWGNPDLTGGTELYTIYYEQWDFSLECWKYTIDPAWLQLLTANPDCPPDDAKWSYMTLPYYDCFREANAADGSGYWHDGISPDWISKGINDSWVDSADELNNRYDGPRSPLQDHRVMWWLRNAEIPHTEVYGSSRHDVKVPRYLGPTPPVAIIKPRPPGGGILPPGVTISGPIFQALTSSRGCLGIRLYQKQEEGDA